MSGYPEAFKEEISSELNQILEYWVKFSPDEENGGFVGRRDHYNNLIPDSSKGIILNTRILWTFSAIGNFRQNMELKNYADRAFNYLEEHFQDKNFGGVFWEVDTGGNPVNRKKQIYAQAFAIYALAEYFLFTGKEQAKEWALSIFSLVEKHARDKSKNGYFEAFREDWSPIEDMRLSEKDKNSAKTMNTHLHLLEAYTSLLQITDDEDVKKALRNLVKLFLDKFYQEHNQHFQLFFDEQWNKEGNIVSFGHDIEAVWLLVEAAKAVEDSGLVEKTEQVTAAVAATFLKEAYVKKAGVINEIDLETGEEDKDRHWWPQAEAMVGLQYASEISGREEFRDAVEDIWDYTKENIIDKKNGEWFFRVNENNQPYEEEDKLGMWKCPYHNSRACIILLEKMNYEKN